MVPAWKLASALALLSIGCRSGSTPSRQDHTLTVECTVAGAFREAWKAAFEKASPGWKLSFLSSRNPPPDILELHGDAQELVRAAEIQPLPNVFYEKFGVALPESNRSQRYIAGGAQTLLGMSANIALCERAGIKGPPRTWEAFVDDLDRLKTLGIMPIVFADDKPSILLSCLLQTSLYPGSFTPSWTEDRNQGKARFATDPEAKAAVKAFIGVLGRLASKAPSGDAAFLQGKAAFLIGGPDIGRSLEAAASSIRADFWPMPSLLGGDPKFIAPNPSEGWAVSSRISGERLSSVENALESIYDPRVYQLLLDAKSGLGLASKVAAKAPQSDWKPAQHLYNSLAENFGRYGSISGEHVAPDNQWPADFERVLGQVAGEVLRGNKDVRSLLRMLDDGWDGPKR